MSPDLTGDDGVMQYGIVHSRRLDMAPYLECFAPHAQEVRVVTEEMHHDPSRISFALLWEPDDDFFERYPNVRLAASTGAGVDNILACPSITPEVAVCRNRDPEQAAMMSTFALWHLLSHQRGFMTYLAQQRRQEWRSQPARAPGDIPVGVLGMGFMGERIARDCHALGFRVAGWRRRAQPSATPGVEVFAGQEQLQAFLNRTEVLINVLPLTEETRGILNRTLFEQLRPGAYLIQLGRGSHLKEEDLWRALECGQLAGASLDVFDQEPLPAESPLWRDPRIIVTPHDASDVRPSAAVDNLLAELRRLRAGEPLQNEVLPGVGY